MERTKTSKIRITVSSIVVLIVIALIVGHLYQRQKKPIKIGLATTLTGSSSTSGIYARNGAILAIEQINREGGVNGRPIELIVRNDKGDPEEALRVDLELIEEGVAAIIGHPTSTLCVKAVPLMNEKKILMLAVGSTPELSDLDDYYIRLALSDDRYAPLMAELSHNRLGLKKMAVVCDLSNSKYTAPLYGYFKREFERLGGEVSKNIGFDPRQKFSAPDIAKEIAESDTEGLLLITNAIHGSLICQHLRKQGSRIKFVPSVWAFTDPDFARNGGRAVDGAVGLSIFNGESSNESFIKFKSEYESRFGEPVSSFSQLGYEAVQVLRLGLQKTDDSKQLKDAILKQKVFAGPGGSFMIDEYGEVVRTAFILELRNAKIRTVGKIEPPNRQ